jgi:hypothetical protein
MTSAASLARRPIVVLALVLAGSAVFSAAYCQAPLYYSNQNQYFLHGLAEAGQGLLAEDWLANTADPTPVFTAIVSATAEYLHPWAFHVYQAVLLGAYAAAMFGLFAYLAGPERTTRRWPVFLLLFVAAHSALARWLSYRLVGFDYPWFLQAGVAGQYLLGAMLQPSVFGVLLVVAVCLFVRDQPFLAAACTGLAADLHSTYLLPGALLTLGFLASLLAERRVLTALHTGIIALVFVLPAVGYVLVCFRPTRAETFALAQDILANFRIPHHCRTDLWLDPVAGLQILWIFLAILLVRGSRLYPVLLVPFLLSALLTLVQLATRNETLALLFPWRISAVLVPIATTVILARLVSIPALPLGWRGVQVVSLLGVIGLAGFGVWVNVNRLAFRTSDEEQELLDFVQRTRSPGDVYFIPVRAQNLVATTRGSLSSDFQPLASKKRDARLIQVDLQRFRLHSGAPIWIDFKSIPYRDTEVIEWRDRLFLAQALQERIASGHLREALAVMRQQGITHLVRPAGERLTDPGLELVHDDPAYRVYRLIGGKSQ